MASWPLDGWAVATILVTAAAYGTSLAAAGGVLFATVFPRLPARLTRSVRAIAIGLAAAGLLFCVLRLGIQAGFLAGGGPAGMVDAGLLAFVAGGPAGAAAGLRAAGLLLICGLPAPGGSLGRSRHAAALGGTLLVCLSFLAVGHSTDGPRWLLAPLLLLHLLAAAFWIGALLPLHRAAGMLEPAAAGALMHRFGRRAGWAVGLLLLAGGALAVLLVGGFGNLVGTDYGRMLLGKIALAGALLGFAACNRLWLAPALHAGRPGSAARLRRSIAVEILLVGAIFLLTASLVTLAQAPALQGR